MKYFLGIVCLLITTLTYALQMHAINDNQTVLTKISEKQPSRIFVVGDRIVKVHGIEGNYDLNKDENSGEIFIRPIQHKPFNLFITTELGHNYNLLFEPTDAPAESIELKPLSPSMKKAEHWEKNSPYVQTLINLMQSMTNNEEPEGYAVIDLGEHKAKKLRSGLTMKLQTIYRGNHLEGEIWELNNPTRSIVYVHPKDFYQSNLRAAAIEDEVLHCGDETILYRAVDHG